MTSDDKPKMLPLASTWGDSRPLERGGADEKNFAAVQRTLAEAVTRPASSNAEEVADAARRRQLLAEDSAIDAGMMNVRIDALIRGLTWSAIVQIGYYALRTWWDTRAASKPAHALFQPLPTPMPAPTPMPMPTQTLAHDPREGRAT
jgi:hypothetical protein